MNSEAGVSSLETVSLVSPHRINVSGILAELTLNAIPDVQSLPVGDAPQAQPEPVPRMANTTEQQPRGEAPKRWRLKKAAGMLAVGAVIAMGTSGCTGEAENVPCDSIHPADSHAWKITPAHNPAKVTAQVKGDKKSLGYFRMASKKMGENQNGSDKVQKWYEHADNIRGPYTKLTDGTYQFGGVDVKITSGERPDVLCPVKTKRKKK